MCIARLYTTVTRPRTYFKDETDNDISGLIVLESSDGCVRVTENRSDGWCVPYQMPVDRFREAIDGAKKIGLLPEDKFDRVIETASLEA